MKFALYIALTFCLFHATTFADQLDVGGVKYNGTFNAYENEFHFTTGSGKKRTEKPARVKGLILEEPVEVTFKAQSDHSVHKGILKGYEFSNFLMEIDGKELSVHSSLVLSMRPHQEEVPPPAPEKKQEAPEPIKHQPAATKPRADDIPPEARDSQRYPIPKVDTQSLTRRDLSQEQRRTLESFIAAKASYDAFMQDSSTMVAQLSSATGNKRNKLLTELRTRKNNEQPLKDALLKAHQNLQRDL